jgi:hypothetical protein
MGARSGRLRRRCFGRYADK